jgi:hypothetical protein
MELQLLMAAETFAAYASVRSRVELLEGMASLAVMLTGS